METIAKGTLVKSLCCSREYRAQLDFTPKKAALRTANKVYLRGRCFICILKNELAPELAAAGILVDDNFKI
jgi:hypothetical protein